MKKESQMKHQGSCPDILTMAINVIPIVDEGDTWPQWRGLDKTPAARCRPDEFPAFLLVFCEPLLEAQVGTAGGKREAEVKPGTVVPIGFSADSQWPTVFLCPGEQIFHQGEIFQGDCQVEAIFSTHDDGYSCYDDVSREA